MRFKTFEDGEWMRPIKRGFKHQCCDCGLIHVVDFKIVGGHVSKRTLKVIGQQILMRWSRQNKRRSV